MTVADRERQTFQASPLQQRLWRERTSGDSSAFLQARLLVDGALDEQALDAAYREVLRRHEILRTTFALAATGRGVTQAINDPGAVPGIGRLSAQGEAAVAGLCRAEGEALDPLAGPAFRAALISAPGEQTIMVLTAHVMVADRAALRIVARDLAMAYSGADTGIEAPLQYADFAAWQDELLTAEHGAAERREWSAYLTGLPRPSPLFGLDRPEGDGLGETVARRIGAHVTARLEEFCATHSLPLGHVLAAVFGLVCRRFHGEQEIVVEIVDQARRHGAIRGGVGPYARELPVLCRVDPRDRFLDFARRFAGTADELASRIEYLDPAWRGAESRRSETAYAGFDYVDQLTPLAAGAVSLAMVTESMGGSGSPYLTCVRDGAALNLHFHCAGGRMSSRTVRSVGDSFMVLLSDVLRRRQTPVDELDLLSPAHRESLLLRGRGPTASAQLPCLAESFSRQASETPGRAAVSAGDEEMTYAELEARSNRLAHRLIELGVTPGTTVVVSLDRSADLVAALLAVHKAGAAFVPVDPLFPPGRLGRLLDDCTPAVVICTAACRDQLTRASRDEPAPYHLLVPAQEASRLAALPASPPSVRVGQDDLAYVLYTSGTSGAPVGVEVPHRGLSNYLHWCAEAYQLGDGVGVLTHSSISFDFTLTTLLGPLLLGQCAILVPAGTTVAGLAATLRARRDLSLVKLTPTHLDVLGQLLGADELRGSMRTLVVGGEALGARSIAPFRDAGIRVVNEYGPTETVVGSTAYVVDDQSPWSGPVPIGRPIADTRVHLLDPRGELVPDGAVGEICIGGAGVSNGYLNQADLTARRFRPGPDGEARLYRTGDRGRWRPDGVLEYLGRFDDQVKIQGVRVEPAEVEAVLLGSDHLAQAAVVARRDDDPGRLLPTAGLPTLIAYVVPAGQTPVDHAELAARCRAQLPRESVPKSFVTLGELPMTVNGKLDRSALPKPDAVVRPGGVLAPPRTEKEEILAGSIATVLGLQAVGIDDNYFALGGDSIRSVMVTSRAQSQGVDVTVADLHTYPTVRTCSAYLEEHGSVQQPPAAEPFSLITAQDRDRVPPDAEDVFPLNLLQEGMIFHRDFAAKSAVYHAMASIRLTAPYDQDVLRMAVQHLAERHPLLRTSFDLTSFSRPMQVVHTRFDSPLDAEDLRALPADLQDESIARWISAEKERGFELHEYPLIRFMVHQLTDGEWQFTYAYHHEIIDGWSEALMVAELFSQYFSIVFDEPLAISAPRSSMRDAVALELEALQDSENHDFWARYLADATVMRLPRFGEQPKADKGIRDIARMEVPVPTELSDQLKQLASSTATPLKNVLMAAHLAVMSTYGGQMDTLTYTVTNGRPEHVDGSSAIGLFVNSLALRVRTTGGTWRELIADGLATERASMPFRRLPMAELKRHQGNEPLAETLFFYIDYHVFGVLDRWQERGVDYAVTAQYAESTFPFCAIFRQERKSGHLKVRLEYDRLQFSADLIADIRDCYHQALAAMVADPESRYDLRPPALVAPAQPDTGDGRCLHELIEEQARGRPDAVAVQLDDAMVSYRELNRRANQLAQLLRSRGAGPERIVGVLAERSIEQAVAILAVLKAGSGYLPLEPSQPDAAVAAIVADAKCVAVVAQEQLAVRVPDTMPVIGLDSRLGVADSYPSIAPATGVVAANTAYVIYTSGSTGEPKGVVVEHRSAVASTRTRHSYYPDPVEHFLLLSSAGFDSSVAGIFWTLSQGGTLVLLPEGLQQEPAALLQLTAAQRPTHILGIPTLLRLLIDQSSNEELASLRVMISAGEACLGELATACSRRLPRCSFNNEYGPTEGTVWATVWSAEPGVEYAEQWQVPIGRPITGSQVLPLDHHGQVVPKGVTGQLSIGGAGVARGYLGRPAETAATFVPDRYAGAPGTRCYATGDLGRTLLTGDLEFEGRSDHQVKIQGFRVELGAIEAVLETCPLLERSVVVANVDDHGQRGLVAYVVPSSGDRVEAAVVQQYLRARLPKYMVPAAVVVMDSVPLTPTGKINRRLLPPVRRAELVSSSVYVAPRTDLEGALAAIWRRVLQLDRIGVDDRFFDIGGESLRAMQVVAATNKMFNTKLSVRRLFEAPTLGEFAQEVSQALLSPGTGSAGR
ncbi:amino acid adenylation domain-containing protein [Kribbella sp. NBC_01505]|uniref:amino acid adenylation domain-containing protein n=1 Tax=Kribbella sp. NBC_01505 TaxID=2903580 RepID=UPI003864A824